MTQYIVNMVIINLAACGILLAGGAYTVWGCIMERRRRGVWSLGLIVSIILGGIMAAAMIGYALLFIFVLAGTLES